MTLSETTYIENFIITTFNSPPMLENFKADIECLKHCIQVSLQVNFPMLGVLERDRIIDKIVEKINACGYPKNIIPRTSCRLNLKEILYLTDISKKDLDIAKRTLHRLISVMQDNDDYRSEELGKATYIINEILLSKNEKLGTNL